MEEKNKGGAPSLFEGKDSKAVYSLRSSTKGQIEHLATLVPTSASNVIEGLLELPNIGQQVVDLLKRLATEKKAGR